jgi:GntR family transcriptional regulator, transcriptional repressor for pyruvate dehydrogenase complex
MTDGLPRLRRHHLAATVASVLEGKIVGGEWQPGHRLPSEPELGEQLGVSRSVVRDAMRTLSTRGLVEVRQGFGTVVAQPTTAAYGDAIVVLLRRSQLTIGQVLEARELVETELAGLAAARRTDDDCRRTRGHLDAYRGAVEATAWEAAREAHTAFHLSILAAIHTPALEILLLPMQKVILAAPLPPVVDDLDLWEIELHEGIVSAIEAGAVAVARERMSVHFSFRRSGLYRDAMKQLFRDVPGDDLDGKRGEPQHNGSRNT